MVVFSIVEKHLGWKGHRDILRKRRQQDLENLPRLVVKASIEMILFILNNFLFPFEDIFEFQSTHS